MSSRISRAALLLTCAASIAAVGISPALAADDETVAAAPAPTDGPPQDQPSAGPASQSGQSDKPADTDKGGGTDILSGDTLTLLLDGRLALANGERSFTRRGLGKTRFGGTAGGDYKLYAVPVEADLIWTPRFTDTLSANVSAAWQRNQENAADLIEAFVNWLPPQTGPVGLQVRAGLMWPEISLEHSTGGAWSVVDTITPSAINSWVGEEVKVIGLEGTIRTDIGGSTFGLTGAVFGFDDTSGTLLSFRGWALQDEKATAFGHFKLPPLNPFMTFAQQNETRSLIELDNRPGWYARLDWRAAAPFGAALFYYDNRGNPEKFTLNLQWGWRTRFWNLAFDADLDSRTRLLAQGMTGSTIMGFKRNGVPWVHTHFSSAFVMLSHRLTDKWNVAGRVEAFRTHESGSEMSPLDSEHGWSWTAALKYLLNDHVTLKAEALNVRSTRGVRLTDLGIDPFQAQSVFQFAVQVRL
ncbi:MAG TPA: hypothetical protein VIC34_03780 [Croceibacterium sp.]|jgi:hypothetical protein